MNIFEAAAREKLRFSSSKGLLSVEDVWDLPLSSTSGKANLNDIAIGLHRELRAVSEIVSFVDDSAKPDQTVQLRFDIVKHIIEQRKKENAEAANAKARAETKQQLLGALARKREGAIESMSEQDLLKKLSEL